MSMPRLSILTVHPQAHDLLFVLFCCSLVLGNFTCPMTIVWWSQCQWKNHKENTVNKSHKTVHNKTWVYLCNKYSIITAIAIMLLVVNLVRKSAEDWCLTCSELMLVVSIWHASNIPMHFIHVTSPMLKTRPYPCPVKIGSVLPARPVKLQDTALLSRFQSSRETHWVRQYLINEVLFGIKDV